MSVVATDIEICNLALNELGDRGSVENIAVPKKPVERIFARWYHVIRQMALKEQMPNFALARRLVAQDLNKTPDFGYSYAYEYPQDCVRFLGIGEQAEKENNYSIENNAILTDLDYVDDGLPIRFIIDETDVTKFSSEFVLVISKMLAYATCYEITQDDQKKLIIEKDLKILKVSASALSGMENRPIRINNSKFSKSRRSNFPSNYVKK